MNKNFKKFISTLAITGAIISVGATASHANEKEELTNANFPGAIAIQSNLGEEATPSYIMNQEVKSEAGGESKTVLYGLPMFNGNTELTDKDGKTEVESFVEWLKVEDKELASVFKGKLTPCTTQFDKAWEKASKMDEERFALAQQKYVFDNKIKPIADTVKDTYKIDLLQDRASEELMYSLVIQFGLEESAQILADSIKAKEITSKSTSDDIVNAIQESRMDTINKNKVLRSTIKKALVKSIEQETDELNKLLDIDVLMIEDDKEDKLDKPVQKDTKDIKDTDKILGSIFKK